MKKIIKIIEFISEGVLCLGVICVICIHVLGFAGIDTFIVRSGSMEPAIKTGSLCFADTKINYDEIERNDIIVFERGNLLVTHRVIEKTDRGFITKGDNNDIDDGMTTTKENFVGKTVYSIPGMGYIVNWLQSKTGKLSVAIYVIILLTIQWISSSQKLYRIDESEINRNIENK